MRFSEEGWSFLAKLDEQWTDIENFDKIQALGHLHDTLKDLKQHYRMGIWPIHFLRMMYRGSNGGRCPMKGIDVSKLIMFFIGNRYNLWCIVNYILLRIVASDIIDKARRARRTMLRIVYTYEAVLRNQTKTRYFDLDSLQWQTVE